MNQTQLSNQYEIELHSQILKLFHNLDIKLNDNRLGSKIYTNYQRFALIVLFMRSRKPLRQFVDELKESKWPNWIGLREIPSKSVVHNWILKWNVTWLRKVLDKTVSETSPSIMAIDATGFDSWQRSRHYERRLKQCGVIDVMMPYAKVDLLVDTKNKLIYDFVLRTKPRHDVLGAKSIFKRFKFKNILILADKGYDCEELYEIINRSGNSFYAPVRDFKVKKPKGKFRRKSVLGHEQYFQRNIVESINFSLKSRFRGLRSKLHYMKKREFAWKIITYNLEKLSSIQKLLFKLLFELLFLDRADSKVSFI